VETSTLEDLTKKLKEVYNQTQDFLRPSLKEEVEKLLSISNIITRLKKLNEKIEEVRGGKLSITSLRSEAEYIYQHSSHYLPEIISTIIDRLRTYTDEDINNIIEEVEHFKNETLKRIPPHIVYPELERVYSKLLEITKEGKEEKKEIKEGVEVEVPETIVPDAKVLRSLHTKLSEITKSSYVKFGSIRKHLKMFVEAATLAGADDLAEGYALYLDSLREGGYESDDVLRRRDVERLKELLEDLDIYLKRMEGIKHAISRQA
jgi:hypothetical protein